MRDDPYAKLSALDQKLFAATSEAVKGGGASTPKGRKKERPDVREKDGTSVGKKNQPSRRPAQRTKDRPEVGRKEPASGDRTEGTFQPPAQPMRERVTRRPYDFFRDQILWLNRTKVEIHEQYDRRITANAMVQLALDLLIADYKRRKERSKLVTELVLNQRTEERPSGRS
jgi:hypothetical protein